MMNNIPEQVTKLYEQLENIFRIFKHGRREQILFYLAILCLAIILFLPEALIKLITDPESENFQIVRKGLLVIGIILFLWDIVLVWQKATPRKIEVTETVKPSAIKGPFAFGEMDGKIFTQLGREADLRKLLSWVLDSQICFTALKGESGAGKTSLLRAGLVYTLQQEKEKYGITPVYWEARSGKPAEDLLRAIHLACPDEKANLRALEDVPDTTCGARKVIIIDQAEQLSPEKNPEFFKLFKKIIAQKPPYSTTWIIAFREEYASTWFDFECNVPDFHPPKHSLKIFTKEQALENMAVLARESGLAPDTAVLEEMVNAMSDQGKVSPVEIGIGMMVLSELYTGPDRDIKLSGFRDAGGVTGLLRTYIKNKLDEGIPKHEHSAMESALLALVDPEKPHQRLSNGKSVTELAAVSQLPLNRLQHNLAFLASQTVRILEQLSAGSEPIYRLAHERLIPALESLAREILAAAEQAKRLLQERYLTWSRARQPKFLLSGRELRTVLKYRTHFQDEMNPEQRRYLRDSKIRRNRLIGFSVIGVLVVIMLILLLPTLNSRVVEPWQRNQRIQALKEQFVLVDSGTFDMGDVWSVQWGDSAESDLFPLQREDSDLFYYVSGPGLPVHQVKLNRFKISKYEITNQQYCDFLNSDDLAKIYPDNWLNFESSFCHIRPDAGHFVVSKGMEQHPVVTVSWDGANAFARWMGGGCPPRLSGNTLPVVVI
ncbi:SUMF1/EgtB/PvdO family nonheme iron enzyme [candidate division KSB1 bacterium]|nr:SUMF1/EgtB/PvdO family nonheme iron enzyme [candidate division KSB1 bacterium]